MYQGLTADFPCGRGGFDANANVYQVPINNLVKARNVRYDGLALRKAPGLQAYDDTAIVGSPTALQGFDYMPTDGTQRQVTAWNNGDIYKEVSGDIDSVTLVSGLTFTRTVSFVEGGEINPGDPKQLYMFSRGVAPLRLDGDGTSMVPITAESIDWAGDNKPGAAINHDSRIVAFNVPGAEHNFYLSTLSDHGDFNGTGSKVFSLAPGIGQSVVAAFSYLTTLYLWKYPRGLWSVDTTDLTLPLLPTVLIRPDIGMAGPHGVTKVGDDVIFISANGRLYSLQALRPDIDPIEADITAKLRLQEFIKQFVDVGKLRSARLIYDEQRRELWYIFTSKNADTNDMALVFDLNEMGLSKAAVEDRGEFFNAAWLYRASDGVTKLLVGGAQGFVYKANMISRNANGAAYTAEAQWPSTDLKFVDARVAARTKRFDMLEATVLPTGAYDISFEIVVDGKSVKTVSIALGNGSSVFDDAIFDTDIFGGFQTIKHRVELGVVGEQISLHAYNSGLNEDFALANVRLYFQVQGQPYEA